MRGEQLAARLAVAVFARKRAAVAHHQIRRLFEKFAATS